MRNFFIGLAAGVVVGVSGGLLYLTTGEKVSQFAVAQCQMVLFFNKGQPVDAAADTFGPDKAERALDLCRLILE